MFSTKTCFICRDSQQKTSCSLHPPPKQKNWKSSFIHATMIDFWRLRRWAFWTSTKDVPNFICATSLQIMMVYKSHRMRQRKLHLWKLWAHFSIVSTLFLNFTIQKQFKLFSGIPNSISIVRYTCIIFVITRVVQKLLKQLKYCLF